MKTVPEIIARLRNELSLHPEEKETTFAGDIRALCDSHERLRKFAEGVAENAEHYADTYTELESMRIELRGFAESACAALNETKP